MRILKLTTYVIYLIIAVIILLEIALRVLGFHGESDSRDFIQYDKEIGWSLIPNADVINTGFEWKVRYRINEKGLRGEPIKNENKDSVFRILVLGDSFSEGYGIEEDKRFSVLIKEISAKNNINIEIINAGVRGYNLCQYYLVFQELYSLWRPQLVIVAAVMGDLDVVTDSILMQGNIVYYRPYYILSSEGRLLLKGIPVVRPDRFVFENDKLEFIKKNLRNSAAYCFLRIVSDGNILLRKIGIALGLKKDSSNIKEYEIFKYDPMLKNKEENEKVSSSLLKEMYQTIRKDNGNLLVFLLTDDAIGNNAEFFKRASRDIGFLYASFFDINQVYFKNKSRYHFKFDNHFNEKGNSLVAESLLKLCLEKGLFNY